MPSSSAVATKASKSSMVPRSGWTASWPPASEPIAQGLPGSSGPRSRLLFGRLLEGAAGGGGGALGAREELVPGAVQGAGPVDPERQPPGAGDVLWRVAV